MADARSELIGAVAEELGVAPLSEREVDAVLALAGAAAHGTGDRTAAPLSCFLAGLAAGSERRDALERIRSFVEARTTGAQEVAS